MKTDFGLAQCPQETKRFSNGVWTDLGAIAGVVTV